MPLFGPGTGSRADGPLTLSMWMRPYNASVALADKNADCDVRFRPQPTSWLAVSKSAEGKPDARRSSGEVCK